MQDQPDRQDTYNPFSSMPFEAALKPLLAAEKKMLPHF